MGSQGLNFHYLNGYLLHSGMMETYTLKNYTNLISQQQRVESRGETRIVVMHHRNSLTFFAC